MVIHVDRNRSLIENIVDGVCESENGYKILMPRLYDALNQEGGYFFDSIYIVLDSELGPPAIACHFDCDDEDDHYIFYDVEFSFEELAYFERSNFA